MFMENKLTTSGDALSSAVAPLVATAIAAAMVIAPT